jgi:hypothetical protein
MGLAHWIATVGVFGVHMLVEDVVDKELFDRMYDVTIAASFCPRGFHMIWKCIP